jgi:hypothetical protein
VSADLPAAGPLTDDVVRERAYEISQRPGAGTAEENWRRAVQELHEELRERMATAAQPESVVRPFPPFTSATTHP